MKNLITILFVLFLFSCQKEPCETANVKVKNMGEVPLTLYFDQAEKVYPGETTTLVFTGNQMPVSYLWDGEQTKKDTIVQVAFCETITVNLYD